MQQNYRLDKVLYIRACPLGMFSLSWEEAQSSLLEDERPGRTETVKSLNHEKL